MLFVMLDYKDLGGVLILLNYFRVADLKIAKTGFKVKALRKCSVQVCVRPVLSHQCVHFASVVMISESQFVVWPYLEFLVSISEI